jgi:rare lipoprotein A
VSSILAGIAIIGAITSVAGPASAEQPVALGAATLPVSAALVTSAIADIEPSKSIVSQPSYETIASGMASYYGKELAGNRTASGERFNPAALTAAHRTLPLGSKVRITNPKNGNMVTVRINDRGPFHSSRLIDLSEEAARQLGIRSKGSGVVELAVAAN